MSDKERKRRDGMHYYNKVASRAESRYVRQAEGVERLYPPEQVDFRELIDRYRRSLERAKAR